MFQKIKYFLRRRRGLASRYQVRLISITPPLRPLPKSILLPSPPAEYWQGGISPELEEMIRSYENNLELSSEENKG